jgi:hypothetical protein
MIIGGTRPEEARVRDTHVGYHSFHDENGDCHGSFEIFWHGGKYITHGVHSETEGEADEWSPGWYWWSCFPGCIPDGSPDGPYSSSRDALEAADEHNPEFDE